MTAYQLIFPLLSCFKVLSFKVTNLKTSESIIEKLSLAIDQRQRDAVQRIKRLSDGLQFTIYLQETNDQAMQEMFFKIEKTLIKHDIRPGKIDPSDLALGKYISVRHQGTSDYLAARYCNNYNPENVKVPYQTIVLDRVACRIL